jgi:hypothetical protein
MNAVESSEIRGGLAQSQNRVRIDKKDMKRG